MNYHSFRFPCTSLPNYRIYIQVRLCLWLGIVFRLSEKGKKRSLVKKVIKYELSAIIL